MHVYMMPIRMNAMRRPPQPALGQAQVPAGEISGDDVGNTEPCQQDPPGRSAFELTVMEVALVVVDGVLQGT